MSSTSVAQPAVPEAAMKTRRRDSLLWLLNPRLAIGLTILAVFVLGSLILPFFCPVDPSLQATYLKNLPMSLVPKSV